MFTSLSILPMIIIFVYSDAISVDLYQSKRVPRRHTAVVRRHHFNHPPMKESYFLFPVPVMYDDLREIDLNNPNAKEKKLRSVVRSVNHPPLSEKINSFPVNDYEDLLLKPRIRSIKYADPDTKESDNIVVAKTSTALETNTKHKAQRRRSHVRKVKVSKSQLDIYINESESDVNQEKTSNKVGQREVKTGIDQNFTKKQPLKSSNQQGYKRRKGLRDPVVPIIKSESYVFAHSGNYHYSYEGGDGTKAFARGEMNDRTGSAVEGSFSYKDEDGNDFSLSYTADENGYRPVGAHLPTPPPIPPAIQRAIDILATKTTPEPVTERIKTLRQMSQIT